MSETVGARQHETPTDRCVCSHARGHHTRVRYVSSSSVRDADGCAFGDCGCPRFLTPAVTTATPARPQGAAQQGSVADDPSYGVEIEGWLRGHPHEHAAVVLGLRTRTRLVGTLNLAVALRGRSCGWGTCARPRRTFIGFQRGSEPAFHRGVELTLRRGSRERTLVQRKLGSGRTSWRSLR